MVCTVSRVSDDGDVTEVSLIVVSSVRNRIVVPATQVLPCSPEGWKITFIRDFSMFLFPPNVTQSYWVQASRLGVQFYSAFEVGGGPRNQMLCTGAERTEHNLTDFQVKLCVKPASDARGAMAVFVALPVTTQGLSALRSSEIARSGQGYPVLMLAEDQLMAMGPRMHAADAEHFGLPMLPVLMMTPGALAPSPSSVLTSTLALWGNATTPRLVPADEFAQMTGIDPVITTEVPAEWRWPYTPDNDSENNSMGE